MAYKALIYGTGDLYPHLKPFYEAEVKRGNLEIVTTSEPRKNKFKILYNDGKNHDVSEFDLAIISSRQFFYKYMTMLESIGFTRDRIIDGTVFIVPNLDFPLFLEEKVAHGFLEKTIFKLCIQTIHPQIYKIKGRKGSLSMGMMSYINANSTFVGNGEVSIQKFCPIARNTTFMLGENRDHNYNNVSSAPIWYFNWKTAKKKSVQPQGMCKISIGNDVWIGWNCILSSNNPDKPLIIGDGAVIAANSVVVKNVPPYAIVGGNPAQVIKYRFPPEIVEALLRIKWWDWDIDKLYGNFKYFNNIKKFVAMHDK
ncbi:MAG: CatB-related O-acetyltransferase [Selenomonadaceae bacterium]|nr:CatB-related O-acetyltransferase [Selenomonadaceae bacterium]